MIPDHNLKSKQTINKRRHEFLLTFFDKPDHYEAKEVNGYILVRNWNGDGKCWQVSIYSKESYSRLEENNKRQTTLL